MPGSGRRKHRGKNHKKNVSEKAREAKQATPKMLTKGWGQKETSIGFGPIVGFPDRLRINLKTVEENVSTFTGSATPSAWTFDANSAFDPDYTFTGHSPEYFEQLAAIYNEYCVIGFSAEIEIENKSTTVPAFFVVQVSDKLSDGSRDVEHLVMDRYSKSTEVGIAGGNRESVKIIVPKTTVMEIYGRSDEKEILVDEDFTTTVTADPAAHVFMFLKAASQDGLSNVNLIVRIRLVQEVLFFARTNIDPALVREIKNKNNVAPANPTTSKDEGKNTEKSTFQVQENTPKASLRTKMLGQKLKK